MLLSRDPALVSAVPGLQPIGLIAMPPTPEEQKEAADIVIEPYVHEKRLVDCMRSVRVDAGDPPTQRGLARSTPRSPRAGAW